jgi:hypothetical protein
MYTRKTVSLSQITKEMLSTTTPEMAAQIKRLASQPVGTYVEAWVIEGMAHTHAQMVDLAFYQGKAPTKCLKIQG